MKEEIGNTRLPWWYLNWHIRILDRLPLSIIIAAGVISYAVVAFVCSGVLWLSVMNGRYMVYENKEPVLCFWKILYFNFVTILTVGYGDLHPVGWACALAVIEALLGVAFLSGLIGIVVLKITRPRKRSIVFSKYAYYARDRQQLAVIFVNTDRAPLVNAEISAVVKIGRFNPLRRPFATPYIGKSVWIFETEEIAEETIPELDIWKDDGIKFGVSGTYGFATFGTAIKYTFDSVLVVQSLLHLRQEQLFQEPNLRSRHFRRLFHYSPAEAVSFKEYAEQVGAHVHHVE